MRTVVGLLLVAAGMAACVDSRDAPALASALELRDVAQSHAARWAEDAELYAAWTLEAADNGSNADAASPDWPAPADPRPGDGRSPAWAFAFVSKAKEEGLGVLVAHNGTILESGDVEPLFQPLGDIVAVSPSAFDSGTAALLAAENESWRSLVGSAEQVYMLLIQPPRLDPQWFLAAEDENDKPQMLLVNATTGFVQDGHPFLTVAAIPMFHPLADGGKFGGRLTTIQPASEHRFQVQDDHHPLLRVTLRALAGSPTDRLNLTLTSPEGDVHSRDVAASAPQSLRLSVKDPQDGTWTAKVELKPGLAAEYELYWCAVGQSPLIALPTAPCENA